MRRRKLSDRDGEIIYPDESPEYPEEEIRGDLTGGDLSATVTVSRAQALVVVARSEEGNTFDVTVEWELSDGTTVLSSSATDIGMSGVTGDWTRLVRKGAQATVTFTDTSGAGANNVVAFIDSHR